MTLMRPKTDISKVIAGITRMSCLVFEPGISAADQRQSAAERKEAVTEQKHLALFQKSAVWKMLERAQERIVLKPNQKGEFRSRIRPRVPGIYTAVMTIDGEVERTGRFTRTMTAVIVVRSAN